MLKLLGKKDQRKNRSVDQLGLNLEDDADFDLASSDVDTYTLYSPSSKGRSSFDDALMTKDDEANFKSRKKISKHRILHPFSHGKRKQKLVRTEDESNVKEEINSPTVTRLHEKIKELEAFLEAKSITLRETENIRSDECATYKQRIAALEKLLESHSIQLPDTPNSDSVTEDKAVQNPCTMNDLSQSIEARLQAAEEANRFLQEEKKKILGEIMRVIFERNEAKRQLDEFKVQSIKESLSTNKGICKYTSLSKSTTKMIQIKGDSNDSLLSSKTEDNHHLMELQNLSDEYKKKLNISNQMCGSMKNECFKLKRKLQEADNQVGLSAIWFNQVQGEKNTLSCQRDEVLAELKSIEQQLEQALFENKQLVSEKNKLQLKLQTVYDELDSLESKKVESVSGLRRQLEQVTQERNNAQEEQLDMSRRLHLQSKLIEAQTTNSKTKIAEIQKQNKMLRDELQALKTKSENDESSNTESKIDESTITKSSLCSLNAFPCQMINITPEKRNISQTKKTRKSNKSQNLSQSDTAADSELATKNKLIKPTSSTVISEEFLNLISNSTGIQSDDTGCISSSNFVMNSSDQVTVHKTSPKKEGSTGVKSNSTKKVLSKSSNLTNKSENSKLVSEAEVQFDLIDHISTGNISNNLVVFCCSIPSQIYISEKNAMADICILLKQRLIQDLFEPNIVCEMNIPGDVFPKLLSSLSSTNSTQRPVAASILCRLKKLWSLGEDLREALILSDDSLKTKFLKSHIVSGHWNEFFEQLRGCKSVIETRNSELEKKCSQLDHQLKEVRSLSALKQEKAQMDVEHLKRQLSTAKDLLTSSTFSNKEFFQPRNSTEMKSAMPANCLPVKKISQNYFNNNGSSQRFRPMSSEVPYSNCDNSSLSSLNIGNRVSSMTRAPNGSQGFKGASSGLPVIAIPKRLAFRAQVY